MSRPELYAITSLLSAIAIAGYYLILVFSLPESLDAFVDQLGDVFFKILMFAFVLQLLLDVAQSISSLRVDKDERDRSIEGKAFRNGYYVLMVSVWTTIAHLVIYGFLGTDLEADLVSRIPVFTLHVLLLGTLTAIAVNAASRLYYYRRGA